MRIIRQMFIIFLILILGCATSPKNEEMESKSSPDNSFMAAIFILNRIPPLLSINQEITELNSMEFSWEAYIIKEGEGVVYSISGNRFKSTIEEPDSVSLDKAIFASFFRVKEEERDNIPGCLSELIKGPFKPYVIGDSMLILSVDVPTEAIEGELKDTSKLKVFFRTFTHVDGKVYIDFTDTVRIGETAYDPIDREIPEYIDIRKAKLLFGSKEYEPAIFK